MAQKKPKSFRLHEADVKKLEKIHEYYKDKYEKQVSASNMDNIHKWSEASTLSVLFRDSYEELLEKGLITPIEN
ncbi:hypothetical protein [Priestia megaterium]|uniref:hypothetical protein n=1 Tax=Priestia megaterium TaxID=1404 RepID=UPI0023DAAE3A|nr:hypothetical protein [Priestia megaterium]MDF2010243.1 hypothetical protein [Priestia megaterium]